MRKWLSGRASPCQGEGREFESRFPLLALQMECFFDFFVINEVSRVIIFVTKNIN